jgi:hypothetical protein
MPGGALRLQVEHGARYRVTVRATRLEKVFVSPSVMLPIVAQSGLSELAWRSVRGGYVLTGRYTGPDAVAQFPARVTKVVRLKG